MAPNLSGNDAPASAATLTKFRWRWLTPVVMMAVLATAVVVTEVKPSAQAAVEASDVTWAPNDDPTWELLDDGRCITTQTVTVTTSTTELAELIAPVLQDLPSETDFPEDSGIHDVHANVGFPNGTNRIPVVLHAYLDGDKCQAADAAQTALFGTQGGGKLDTVQLAAAPTWIKGAIAAVVGAAVYVGVSTLVTAGITATGVLAGATAATVAAVTALSGCIGGASSTAVTLMLAGSGGGWKQNLSNAVAGCVTGATIGLLPIKQVGTAAGNAIRTALGYAPVATVGDGVIAAAEVAGVEMTGITEVITTTADAAIAVE